MHMLFRFVKGVTGQSLMGSINTTMTELYYLSLKNIIMCVHCTAHWKILIGPLCMEPTVLTGLQ